MWNWFHLPYVTQSVSLDWFLSPMATLPARMIRSPQDRNFPYLENDTCPVPAPPPPHFFLTGPSSLLALSRLVLSSQLLSGSNLPVVRGANGQWDLGLQTGANLWRAPSPPPRPSDRLENLWDDKTDESQKVNWGLTFPVNTGRLLFCVKWFGLIFV